MEIHCQVSYCQIGSHFLKHTESEDLRRGAGGASALEADERERGVRGTLLDWFCLVEVGVYINALDYARARNAGFCWNLCGDVISTFPGTTWAGFTGGAGVS